MGENDELPIGINYIADTKPEENPYHFWAALPQHNDFLKNEINRNLDEKELREEITFIKNELHCNSLKVMGHSTEEAVRIALVSKEVGLTPWLCPRFIGATFGQTKEMLEQYCATAIQNSLGDSPLVLANELPYDCASDTITGHFTSADYEERGRLLVENYLKKDISINSTERVKELVTIARNAGWTGPLTYAASPEERIDWGQIEDSNIVVGVNLYWGINHQTGEVWKPSDYDSRLKEIIKGANGRPVVITEFGSVPQEEGLKGGGAGWNLNGPINYESQAEAYRAYLEILQSNYVGYFAYAFHESMEDPKERGVDLDKYKLKEKIGDRLHKSFAIAMRDENNRVNKLTPAGKVLADYNLKATGVRGTVMTED